MAHLNTNSYYSIFHHIGKVLNRIFQILLACLNSNKPLIDLWNITSPYAIESCASFEFCDLMLKRLPLLGPSKEFRDSFMFHVSYGINNSLEIPMCNINYLKAFGGRHFLRHDWSLNNGSRKFRSMVLTMLWYQLLWAGNFSIGTSLLPQHLLTLYQKISQSINHTPL